MRILFWLSVIISGCISIIGFGLTHSFTATFDPAGDNVVGENANMGLMFVAFPSLIILYFFFALMFVFEKVHEYFRVNKKRFLLGYFSLFVILIGFSMYRIITFRNEINPSLEYNIGYLNPYSNDLFFNAWTFMTIVCISAFCSFFLKKKATGINATAHLR